jgi:hypothetical protein
MRSALLSREDETQTTQKQVADGQARTPDGSNTTENLKGGFTQVPNSFLLIRLACSIKLTYVYLLYCCRQKDHCWPSIQRIATDLGISCRTVIRAIKVLVTCGFIEKQRRGRNMTNVYYVRRFPEALPYLSREWQIVTSRDANSSLPEMTICRIEEDEETNHTQQETDSRESKIRRTSAALKRKSGERLLSSNQGEQQAIGIVESPPYVEIQRNDETREPNRKVQSGDKTEILNTSKIPEEISHPEHVKEVEKDNTGKAKGYTFEEMTILAGITPESLQAMREWMKTHCRPETIPLKLQGIIPMWSRELGNAEPHLITANLTQASKLYMYARKQGLSQPETESCFEHAREIIRRRPEVTKKMAFFFSSLKLDILIALKQGKDLAASQPSILSSIPDGYDNEVPTSILPTPSKITAPAQPAAPPAPKPEPAPTMPIVELLTIPAGSPQPEWKTWETASWWGERLRDELDPTRTFSRYNVHPTENGRYGFELSLSSQADPIWEELLAESYVTSAMVLQSVETIRTVHESRGTRENKHRHNDEASPRPQRYTNTARRHMQNANSRHTRIY